MRKGLTVLSILMLLAAAACQQPPLWFEGDTFEAALEQARAGEKLILIDFYSPT
jgi:hypothetical protein